MPGAGRDDAEGRTRVGGETMTLHFVAIFIIYDFVKTAKKEDYCLGGIGMTVNGDFGPGNQRI